MSKLLLQRISYKVLYNEMLCIRNLRKATSSMPTIEEKSKLLEQPIKRYPQTKRNEMYPEPVHPVLPSEFKEQELLMLIENILAAPDYNAVFDIYLSEKDKFELRHFHMVLKRLDRLYFESRETIEIHENQIFQSLCYDVWKQVPQMDASLVLYICRHLLQLKIPSNSLVIQSLLQMARHQINEYSLYDLFTLHGILKNVENCNLKEALQIALPTVLENSLKFHFPSDLRFGGMCQLLHICITEKISYLNDVIDCIYKKGLPSLMENSTDDYKRKQLCSLLIKLCDLDTLPLTEGTDENESVVGDLMYYCLDKLVELEVYHIPEDTRLDILRSIGYFFEQTQNYCVIHDKFLSEVSKMCIYQNWDINSLFKIVASQSQLNYVNDELVSYAMSQLNEDILKYLNDVNIPLILFALASSNLPEEESRNAANFILKNFTLDFKNKKVAWIRLAMCLLHFNYFNLNILKGIIDKNFINRYLKNRSDTTYDYQEIANLNKYMKCFEETRELNIHPKFLSNEQELPPAGLTNLLTKMIGNEDFILSDVVTPQGNYIDHVVVLEEGKFLNLKNLEFSEIFNDKTGIKKIAIMEVPESFTVQPQYKLNISCKVNFHLIEQEGFVILPIFEGEINDLREEAPCHIQAKLETFGIHKI